MIWYCMVKQLCQVWRGGHDETPTLLTYLLHETCDIVNVIVDDEPCVFAHVMDFNLLACVIFHAAVLLRRACVFFLHVLVLSVHWARGIFPHIHAVSVASLLEFGGNQCLGFSSKLFLIHLTCPVQFLSSRLTISPPVTRNYPIHSLEPNQPISAQFTRHTPSDGATSSQSESRADHHETTKRHTHVTRTLVSRSRYTTQNLKSSKYLFVCAFILFCDWIYVFIVILLLDCAQIYKYVLIKGLYGFTINGYVLIPFIILDIIIFFQKLLNQILP